MARTGRPSKYDPAFCERVKELAMEGASKAEIAYDLGIAYSTFDKWKNEKPEFSEAIKEAEQISRGWWEKQGRIATFGGHDGFNATSYIFQMKNRFRDEWADRQLHGSDPDNPLPGGPPDLSRLTDAQVDALLALRKSIEGSGE